VFPGVDPHTGVASQAWNHRGWEHAGARAKTSAGRSERVLLLVVLNQALQLLFVALLELTEIIRLL
jgi:hypothetical protein